MIWRVLKVLAFMLSRLLGYLFLGVFARSRREAYVRRIYVQWARYSLEIFSVELEVMGRELVPPEGTVPRIFLVNHQSQLDIPAIVAALYADVPAFLHGAAGTSVPAVSRVVRVRRGRRTRCDPRPIHPRQHRPGR